jgi:hypothetical protein
MSVILLPDIGELDPGSLCYSIYSELYHNFFNAQDKKSEENPYGIEEGDDTSIRLRNTAYNFASAIAGAVAGEGGESGGGILLDYLKKTGGDMRGALRANYGFEAGAGNTRLLGTYEEVADDGVTPVYGLQVYGDIRIGGSNLFIGGRQFIRYTAGDGVVTIEHPVVSFGHSGLCSLGEMVFGENKAKGVAISSETICIKGKEVYHAGNANLPTVNWAMQDGTVAGKLQVVGAVTLSGELSALHGVKLGTGGKEVITLFKEEARLNGFLSIGVGYGVKIGTVPVLYRVNETNVRLACDYGHLLLGSENTQQIRLFSGLTDIDGDNILISKYGAAYFPDSLRVAHNYGADLLSTYRENDADEGLVIHKKMRFGSRQGIFLSGDGRQLFLCSVNDNAAFGFRDSTSVYRLPDSGSRSVYLQTNCDFITFSQAIEAKKSVGIDGSFTRLTDKHLFFTSEHYLLSASDGIKHFGNAYFTGSVGSERFSSGFAGYGWAILKNQTTGNISATFDELTVRKKMRIYELEVQKITATNGSLWVSDSCSGDLVERIS